MSKILDKKKLLGAALLATAPIVKAAGTGQGVSEGGKLQRGVNHLTLEEAPLDKITLCVGKDSMMGGLTSDFRFMNDNVAVVINPFETNFVQMTFVVSHASASDDERVLFLVYSTQTSPSPQIPTPRSLNKLQLDLTFIEIVGQYDVPSFGMEVQAPTRIGAGNPAARVKWEFDINLDTSVIPGMMNNGEDTIYVQAALLRRSDFDAGEFSNMILSEMDTIQFVEQKCPKLIDGRRVIEYNF